MTAPQRKPSLEEAGEMVCSRLETIAQEIAQKPKRRITKRLTDSREPKSRRGSNGG